MHKDCDKTYFKKPEFYRLTGENNYVRIDAEDKVTGHGQYVGDIMFPDILTGKMLRAPFAPARIVSIDISEAEKLPGVKCILTPFNCEWKHKVGNGEFAKEFADKEVLCTEIVRQVGDDVCVVAAIDEETAQMAIDLIKVEYEKLPGVYDPFEAMEEGAPEVNWEGKGLRNIGMQSHMCAGTGFVSGTGFAVLEAPNQSSACVTVRLNKRGMATLYIGSHDIGQGSDTVMTAIVAEELGLPMDMVKTFMSDTYLTPWDSGSYGSRVTFLAGNAARRAAVDAKRQLFEVIAPMWGVMPETLECLEGKVISKEKAELQMPIGDAMFKYMTVKGGDELVGIGSYYHRTDNSQYNGENTTNYAPAYSFSTGAAHVHVDKETGVIDIDEFVFAHDCGRALNRRAVEGQLEGSIGMGLGYAIYEHNVTKEGKILNPNFRDYRLPTALDMPKMRTFYDFAPDAEGPLGAKEAGEGSVAPVAPALANAVNMATGVYFTELPLDPEHIWRALNGMKDDRNSK